MAVTAQININVNSKEAQANTDKLSQSINNAGKSSLSLKNELRQVTVELQGLAPGSARFTELSQRAGQLRDTIADTSAVINATAGNAVENLGKALGNSIQLGVAGFQALSSAQVLFGSENEELNKTLARMGALLNLSQAIQTFGGLGDKLTEIKAGFTPLLQSLGLMATQQTTVAIATGAADAALVGEAVAADGAAVSTGFFAAALNALPLVAIVTALGLLVGGLISYASASGDTEKAAKKRNEALKKQREEEQKATETIAKESAEYVGLIYQLKATNVGSEDRKKLIKDINATYGTTLKNISDETKFQQQLNLEVANYIAYQKAKFQLQKNEEAIGRNLEKQSELEKELAKAQKLYNDEYFIKLKQDDLNAGTRIANLEKYQASINRIKSEIDAANKRLESYGKVAVDVNAVIKDVTKGGKQYGEQLKDNNNSLKDSNGSTEDALDVNEKYAKLLDEVKDKLDREIYAQQTSEKYRIDRINGIQKETEAVNKLYSDERQSIIDKALKNELEALDIKFKKQGKTEQAYLDAAKIIKDNYQTYLLDSEKKLLEQLDVYQKEDLQKVQDNYTTKEKIVQETTQNIITNTQLLQIQYEKSEAIRVIDESIKTEEEKNKAKLEVRKKYAQQEIDLLNKNLQEQKNLAKLSLDQTLADTDKTIAEKEQAQADYDQKIVKMTQDTADKINAINAEVKSPIDKSDLDESLEEISKYVDAVANLFNQLSTTLSMIQEERSKNEEARIEGMYEFEKDSLDNQLAENIISRDQYDNKVKELDQQKEQETLQLRRQEFQSNKRLNMANAVITGAQAVLSTFAGTPGGLIIKGIAAALAATFAAIQFGVISSQEFTAAGGGIVPGTGSGDVDSVRSFLAPGETVINTQSSQMYPELLNSINMAGGGVSLKPDLPAVNKPDGELRVFGDNKINQPLRAYVVETDVTDTQRRVDRIKRSAEF
jgi:hypothetical protein